LPDLCQQAIPEMMKPLAPGLNLPGTLVSDIEM
jgi:hypothetical protein